VRPANPFRLTTRRVLAGSAVIAALIVVLRLVWLTPKTVTNPLNSGGEKIAACTRDALSLIKPESINISLLEQISSYCYVRIHNEEMLGDFTIRSSTFVRQHFQADVLLWTVLAITLSGIALAALQLLAAYRLALSGRGVENLAQAQELVLEHNKISLKSSVTGLLILIVSFAFFMVYVSWVFTIREMPLVREQQPKNSETEKMLPGVGGVGEPPS
jgi:hypothetical protein